MIARLGAMIDGAWVFGKSHGGSLLATAFPKEHRVQQGEVVENKRLSVVLGFIQEQRERTEAKAAKPSTTRRAARLLSAAMGSSAETRP